MALCQHVNNVFCTLCNIFWFCHLWLIFMTLLFRKLVNKTDIFLVAFLFLEPSTPCKKQNYMHYWYYVNWYFKLKNLQAMKLVVAYCPEVKLLPACLTCQFNGQMEDWSFMLTSHSENMYKCIAWKSICSWVLCCSKPPEDTLSFLLCLMSAMGTFSPAALYGFILVA